jgi:phosphopantetheinyl transferase
LKKKTRFTDVFYLKNIKIGDSTLHFIRFDEFNVNDYTYLLTKDEQFKLSTFKSEKRKKEFVATRILKTTLFNDSPICYLPSGAPYLKNANIHISISHCDNWVVFAVCDRYKIGVDIEPISNKAQRLHLKFLNETEIALLDTSNIELMSKAWSSKEALYKLSTKEGIIFKEDLLITDFDGENTFKCKILDENKSFFVYLNASIIDGYIVTINTSPLYENH